MKVLFISRATLYSVKGGDTVQMENTAKELGKLGVGVSIELAGNTTIDYGSYDLIHFFNITRPADIMYHMDKSRLPFVVSPIYVEYEDAYKYSRKYKNRIFSLIGKNAMEYLKCIGRWLKNGEKIMAVRYILYGHRRSVGYILKRCCFLLPNSQSEFMRLKEDFKCAGRYTVIPNGIDTDLFRLEMPLRQRAKSVLCVARFEPRKNQINIIKALNATDYTLTLVGGVAPNHQDYYQECKNMAAENVKILNYMEQEAIVRLYRQNKVHILASWFETTGLSSLEAAACGCNVVISEKGDTKEYFGHNGQYCDPGDTCSIKSSIDRAMNAIINTTFNSRIMREYNWAQAGIKTYKTYLAVLNRE